MSDLTIITKLETLPPEFKEEVNNFIDLLIEKSVRTCDELEFQAKSNSFRILPITFINVKEWLKLPLFHKDPFDRIIISQAKCENFTIISWDFNFENYEIPVIWQ